MMATSKYVQVVNRLIDKTSKNELEWKETADGNGYQVAFPEYSLVLREEDVDYIIYIINSEGVVVDQFSDVDLDRDEGLTGADLRYYPLMKDLFYSARRQALGVDRALDAILKELGRD